MHTTTSNTTTLSHLSVSTLEYIESRLSGWTRYCTSLERQFSRVLRRFGHDADALLASVHHELATR